MKKFIKIFNLLKILLVIFISFISFITIRNIYTNSLASHCFLEAVYISPYKNYKNLPINRENHYRIGDTIHIRYYSPIFHSVNRAKFKMGTTKFVNEGDYLVTNIDENVVYLDKIGWFNLDYNLKNPNIIKTISPSSYSKENELNAKLDGIKYKNWFNQLYPFFGPNYSPWCGNYIAYIGSKLGYSDVIPPFPLPEDFAKFYKSRKTILKSRKNFIPQQDMLIFYDWDNDLYIDHIGIVLEVQNDNIITVEGNMGEIGSTDHTSMIQRRDINEEYIVGYALLGFKNTIFENELISNSVYIELK